MTIRILNAEPAGYCPEARAILASLGELTETAVSQADLVRVVGSFDVLIVRLGVHVNAEVINAAERLRVLVSATTGLDHIDLEAAKRRGITVLSLKGEIAFLESVSSTAEHTFGLLLSLLRQIPAAVYDVRNGGWDRNMFPGREVRGMRMGILGYGRLGKKVAHYGVAFGMLVKAFDVRAIDAPSPIEMCDTLEELLAWSEVLSIHLPLQESTTNVIDHRCLQLLPRGAYLVNTARGALIDEGALLQCLESGQLAGAALDVLANEISPDFNTANPLMDYMNSNNKLIITPHLGGATVDAWRNTEVFMAKKLRRFLNCPPG
jgi:D-3-phosphoglycerate dehydrogenase